MCSTQQSSVPYGVVRIRKWATHALNGLEKSPHSTTVHIGKFDTLRVVKCMYAFVRKYLCSCHNTKQMNIFYPESENLNFGDF